MGELSEILEWSLMSTIVIGVIALIRVCFKKQMKKTWQYSLWFVVLLRLLIPELPESNFSLFNVLPSTGNPVVYQRDSMDEEVKPIEAINEQEIKVEAPISSPISATGDKSTKNEVIFYRLWQAGVLVSLVYFMIVYYNMRKYLRNLPEVQEVAIRQLAFRVAERLGIKTSKIRIVYGQEPMIFGMNKPVVSLPLGYELNELEIMITHEMIHYKYKDHFVTYLQVLALAIHWFNPLVWWAMGKMKQDMEFACDERVLQLGVSKKAYLAALLKLTTAPIKGGYLVHSMKESGEEAKRRIMHLANWKKPSKWIGAGIAILIVIIGIGCLTQPSSSKSIKEEVNGEVETVIKPLAKNKEVDIALLGVDAEGYRFDTLVVLSIDTKTKYTEAVFIPRDTKIIWDDEQKEILKERGVKEVEKSKLSEMTAYGGIENIEALTLKELEELTQKSIEHYAVVDLKCIREVVDAIGGLEIDVPQDMRYMDRTQGLNIDLKAGLQVLAGEQVEQIIRFRRYKQGDLGRIETQKLVIDALVEKVSDSNSMREMLTIVRQLYKGIRTNITVEEMNEYCEIVPHILQGDIKLKIIPGEGAYEEGRSYYMPKGVQ